MGTNTYLKVIYTFLLYIFTLNTVAQHGYSQIEPNDYSSGYDFCKACNSLAFYITAFFSLISSIISYYLLKLDSNISKYLSYSIFLLTIGFLFFISDYPIFDVLLATIGIFFGIGAFLIFIIILVFIHVIILRISKVIFKALIQISKK